MIMTMLMFMFMIMCMLIIITAGRHAARRALPLPKDLVHVWGSPRPHNDSRKARDVFARPRTN